MYAAWVNAHFATKEEADQALKDMEEAVGKNNGEVEESEVEEV